MAKDKIGERWSPIVADGLEYARKQRTSSKALWAILSVLRDADIAGYEYSKKKKHEFSTAEAELYNTREIISYKLGEWLKEMKIPKAEINDFLDELMDKKPRPKRKQRSKKG